MNARLLLIAFLVSLPGGMLQANPNTGDPASGFEPLLKDSAGALVGEGEALYKQIVASNRRNVEAVDDGRPERIKPDDLADTIMALHRLNRLGRRLADAGETAGNDFQHRYREEHVIASRLINGTRSFPTAVAHLEKSRMIIARSTESRMRELKQIEEMAKKEQWEQAETRLYRTLEQLYGLTTYVNSNPESAAIYGPYAEAQAAIDSAMASERRQIVRDLLAAQRDAQTPKFDAILQELSAATQAIAQMGTAEIDGQPLDGPALVTHFGEKWKELQTAAVRCRTTTWAHAQQSGASAIPEGTGAADPMESRYRQFALRMGAALAAIVEADAGRVTGAEVESLHQSYLGALAPLAMHAADESFTARAQQALDALAAKSPELAEQSFAYGAATSEVLRWRRRAAEAAAKSRASQYPAAAQQLLTATQGKAPFGGLFYGERPDFPRAQLYASGPAVIDWASDKLLEKPVWVPETSAVAAGKTGVSRYIDRTYCTVALPAPPADQIAALEHDLMADASRVPLSLAAAAALESARRGDFAAAGGTIRAYHLESVLGRWGNLPQSAWVLSRLGELPPEENVPTLSNHVLARFDVTPQWIRHEYFFAELPAAIGE